MSPSITCVRCLSRSALMPLAISVTLVLVGFLKLFYNMPAAAKGKAMKDFEGKVAFITGGASGIGFGMARTFLKAGMKVVIADNNDRNLAEAREYLKGNNKVHFIKVDVTDREAMARAADETERVFGKVHIVCNNAGINLFNDIGEATYDDWDWILGVNLGGVVNGVRTFVPRIKSHGEGGHVINTASMAAFISSA